MPQERSSVKEFDGDPLEPAAAKAHREARAQFAARRAYKRALRRARNPLRFSLLSLLIMLALVATAAALTVLMAVMLRDAGQAESPAPLVEYIEAPPALDSRSESAQAAATSAPETIVILKADREAQIALDGPAIPTVIITSTPAPIAVGLEVEVIGVGLDKLNVRDRPGLSGSQVLFRMGAGAKLVIIGGPREADGLTWWQARDPQYQADGWAAARYLQTIASDGGSDS